MTIPFLDFFKKKIARPEPVRAIPLPPLEKPSSERFSKTVMPNPTPQNRLHESQHVARVPMPVEPQTPTSRPTISFGPSVSVNRSADLPPAVALALEPRVERAISLELKEVVRQMPEGLVRPLEESDANRQVLLKASEIEKGMASGNPSVSLKTVYEQVPEIFLRKLEPMDQTQVRLPFDKVLEQLSTLQVRSDQKREQAVPQVETPFLKVTLEDDERFGTTTQPLQTEDLPPVRLEMATAEAIAAAEPEPVVREKMFAAPRPVQFSVSTNPSQIGNGNGSGSRQPPPSRQPARIPFKLSPKGTDGPAPQRVPASSGPSVPTSAPTRVPFRISPSDADPSGEKEPWLTHESFAQDATSDATALDSDLQETSAGPVKISLGLKPILQSLSPLQLIGDVSTVPNDALIDVPFSLLESQLSSGRVILKPEEFAQNLPLEHQALFDPKEALGPVVLPLPEILKKLPSASLRMREDQIEQEKGANYMTPFSVKADEDAERMKVAAAPIAKPMVAPVQTETVVAKPPLATPLIVGADIVKPAASTEPDPVTNETVSVLDKAEPMSAGVDSPIDERPAPATGVRSALQTALDTDDELDAKAVVAHVGKMAGVQACAIMFSDGLSLAGTLPEVYEADGLCAMAPQLLQRIENHMTETKLGSLRAMTLSCAKAAVTFFMHDNLCLAALHTKEELASDVRERLARAVDELSRKYAQPV